MNYLLTALGFAMVVNSTNESSRTIGAIVASAGLNDLLRSRKDA